MSRRIIASGTDRIIIASRAGPPGVPGEGISVRDYGALGDGSTDDTVSINNALAAASTNGRTIVFPQTSSHYKITGPLTPASGTIIGGAGKDGAEIRQYTQYKPVFDLFNIDNVTISDLYLVNGPGPTPAPGSAIRGDSAYAYSSGVWTNGSGHHLSNLKIKDFGMGVYFAATNSAGTLNNDGNQRYNNVARDIEIIGVNHGILFMCQTGLTIDGLYCHDHVDSSAGVNPLHAIYATGLSTLYSNQVSVSNCMSINNPTGAAYQFKYINGLTVTNVQSKTCFGLWSGIDLNDVTVNNAVGIDCADIAWLNQMVTNSPRRMSVSNISISMTGDTTAFKNVADDSTFSNVNITSSRNGANNSQYDAIFLGNRCVYDGFKIRNVGSTKARMMLVGIPAHPTSDVTIRNFELTNANNLIDIDTTVTGLTVCDYAPGSQRSIAGSNGIVAFGGAILHSIARRDHVNSYNVNGSSITPLAALETVTKCNVTTNSNFTINAPAIATHYGLFHTIAVTNASGVALGTITWNAIYTLASGFTNPGVGATKIIKFMFDGTNWIEVSRN